MIYTQISIFLIISINLIVGCITKYLTHHLLQCIVSFDSGGNELLN